MADRSSLRSPQAAGPSPFDVFISYARQSGAQTARVLRVACEQAGLSVFLDERDIAPDADFPERLVDAIFDSRLFLALVDDAYLASAWCRREARIALAPYRCRLRDATIPSDPAAGPLRHIGLILAPGPFDEARFQRVFPATLRNTNWVSSAVPGAAVAFVHRRLQEVGGPIAKELDALNAELVRESLLQDVRLPRRPRKPDVVFWGDAIPSSIEQFYGRADEIHRIDAHLLDPGDPDGPAPQGKLVALHALSGLGKSQLAAEYVHRCAFDGRYGAVLWIDAGRDAALLDATYLEALERVAPQAGARLRAERDAASGADAWDPRHRQCIFAALALAARGVPILLVVDAIPDPSQACEGDLGHWIPIAEGIHVIVTSTFAFGVRRTGWVALALAELAEVPALLVLTHDLRRPEENSRTAWIALLRLLGGFPLAIEMVNRLLQRCAISPTEARQLVEQSAERAIDEIDALHASLAAGLAERGAANLSGAIHACFDRISPAARAALQLLSVLADGPLPLSLVQHVREPLTPAVRAELSAHGFLLAAASPAYAGIGRLHRLVAAWIRSRHPPQDPHRRQVLQALYASVHALGGYARSREREAQQLLTHAAHLLRHVFAVVGDESARASVATHNHAIALSCSVARYLDEAGLADAARAVGAAGIRYVGKLGLADRPEHCDACLDLRYVHGYTQLLRGRPRESLRLFAGLLRGQRHGRKLNDRANRAYVRALIGTGEALSNVGRNRSAAAVRRAAHLRSQATMPPADPLRQAAANNWALELMDRGRHGEAADVLRAALGDTARLTPLRARCLANLADALTPRDNPTASPADERLARVFELAALRGLRRMLGRAHRDTLAVQCNAALRALRRDGPRAEPRLLRVVARIRESLGADDDLTRHAVSIVHSLRRVGPTFRPRSLYDGLGPWRANRITTGEFAADPIALDAAPQR